MAKRTENTVKPIEPVIPVAKATVGKKKPTTKAVKAPAKKKAKPAAKKTGKSAGTYTRDDIALRAYFIAEKRRAHGHPGDEHQDWLEAERQLAAESGARKKARKA